VTEAPERLVTPAFVVLAAATLAFFAAGGIVLPAAPRFAKGPLGASETEVGIAIASTAIAALVMRPAVGWASDLFGRRPLLIGGAAVSIIALLLHLVAGTLPVFIAARSLFGAGGAFFFVACLAAAGDLAPAERRGEAFSFLSLSLYLGVAIGPPIGELVLRGDNYAPVWIVAAGATVIALGLSFLTPETAPSVLARRGGDTPRPRARLFHPAGLFPGLLILAGVWGMAGFLAFVPLYVGQLGMEGAGLPLVLYALIVVGLRIVGARLPDRLGAVRLSGTALAASGAGLAVMGLVPTQAGLLIGTAVMAAGVAFTFPALLTLAVSRVTPDERGVVVGTTSVFLDLAFGLAPVALGAVVERAGYAEMFLVSAAFSIAGSAALFLRRAALVRPVAA
jgi:predicted MFS family arabinose efflux permease